MCAITQLGNGPCNEIFTCVSNENVIVSCSWFPQGHSGCLQYLKLLQLQLLSRRSQEFFCFICLQSLTVQLCDILQDPSLRQGANDRRWEPRWGLVGFSGGETRPPRAADRRWGSLMTHKRVKKELMD